MADFFSHIKDKRPAFICYPAGGKESPDYTVEIDHLLKPGASEEALQEFGSELSGDHTEVLAFYKKHDGIELYRQNEMPSIEFFELNQITEKNEEWREWFEMYEDEEMEEELSEFQKYGTAFGEISCSGNYFIWHEGKVYYSSHDGEVEEPLANGFNEFINLIAEDPASLMYKLGCYTRFSDGKTNIQWIPRKYISA